MLFSSPARAMRSQSMHVEGILTMFRIRVMLAVLMVGVIVASGSFGDDKKDDKTPVKVKGTLPANWSKLGLSDEQKQKVYAAQTEVRGKIADLEAKIKELKKHEREEIEKVLTDAQKARLKELLLEKAPATEKKDKDKKEKTESK
jgi:hypothetical protein